MDYYEEKLMKCVKSYKACFWSFIGVAVMLIILLLSGCRTKKSITEKTDIRDSVRIEYVEKIVYKPVKMLFDIPAEKKERETKDTISHLETSFAASDASMTWIDGVAFLRHSLENKPQKIEKQDSVPVVEKEKTVWRTRRVTYNKTLIREKQLSWIQKGFMWTGVFSVLILIPIIILRLKTKFLRR